MAKPGSQWKKWVAIGIAGVVALVIVFGFLGRQAKPNYRTAKVTEGKVESVVLASGTLQPYREVDVGAQVSGQLKTLAVKLGQKVKKGQLLAVIDPVLSINQLQVQHAQLDNLKAQKVSAQARLNKDQLDYDRQKKLLAAHVTTQQAMQAAKATLLIDQAAIAQVDAQIKQARIEVNSAQAKLGYTRIVAPMDGEVVAIVTKQGQTVVAAQQAPIILKLADLGTMTVRAQIPEADVIRLHPGQTAYFTILGEPDQRHYGKLRTIEPAPSSYAQSQGMGASSQTGNQAVFYNALFEVPNADGKLRIDMTAQVSFVLHAADHTLTIPVAALGEKGKNGLYPVRVLGKDGKVTTHQVRIGIDNNIKAQVLSGLKKGQSVVLGSAPAKPGSGSNAVTVSAD